MRPALKYNVCKKLSQLMKVIQLFEIQISERNYQKEFIITTYSDKIQKITNEYSENIESILKEIKLKEEEIKNDIETLYKMKNTNLIDNSTKKIKDSQVLIESKELEYKNNIESLKIEIENIKNKMENEVSSFTKVVKAIKNKIACDIKKQNELFKEECSTHDKEAKIRVNKMQEEFSNSIKKLQIQHQEDIKEINKHDLNGGKSEKMIKKMSELKVKTGEIKKEIIKLKEILEEVKKNKEEAKHSFIGKADITIKELLKNKEFNEKDIKMKKDEKYNMEINIQKKINEKTIEKDEKSKEYKKQLHEISSEYKNKTNDIKSKLENKSKELKINFDSLDKGIQDITKKMSEELNSMKKKHSEYVKKMTIIQSKLHNDLVATTESNNKEIYKFKNKLMQLKQKGREDVMKAQNKHEEDVNEENKKNEKQKSKINKDLEKDNLEAAKQQKQLNDLLVLVDKKRTQFTNEIEQYEKDTKKNTAKATKECEKEIENIKKENESKLTTIESSNTNSINTINAKNKTAIINLKMKMQDKYKLTMDKTMNEELINNSVTEFDQKTMAEFIVFKEKLDSYKDLSVKDNEFKQFDSKIEQLISQKKEKLIEYEQEEKNAIDEFNEMIKEENDRHNNNKIIDNDVSLRIKQINEEKSKIAIEKEKGIKASSDIKVKIEEERKRHEQDMLKYNNTILDLSNMDDADKLKEQIANIKKEKDNQYQTNEKAKEEKYDIECAEKRSRLKSTINEINNKQTEDKSMLLERKDTLKKEKELIEKSFVDEKAKKEAEFREKESEIITQNTKEIDELNKLFAEAKSELISNNDAYNKKINDRHDINVSSIEDINKKKSAEFNKFKNDCNALLDFYNEKISVLTKRKNKARQMMEKRPARQQEIDESERLQSKLQIITNEIQQSMKELTEYRVVLVSKEKEYQKRFGKGPKIGILPVSHKI